MTHRTSPAAVLERLTDLDLTTTQAAKLLGCSTDTLKRRVASTSGVSSRYRVADVVGYAAGQQDAFADDVAEAVQKTVDRMLDGAPPLTPEQAHRIAALLVAGGAA